MEDAQTGQVVATAAEVYDEFFLPALFEQWADQVCDAALVGAGHTVLDVACGTGVLARAARQRVGPTGQVVGVDINDGMLAVARRSEPAIDWQQGAAEELGFDDDHFDAVVCQFGLMFFADRVAALREMRRVARPDGRVVVAVWTGLDQVPGYAAMVELLDELFGSAAAGELRAPYAFDHADELVELFSTAGLDASVDTRNGAARFASIDAWVHTDIKGWTLADSIDDEQYEHLLVAARERLTPFVQPDGTVSFDHPARLVTAIT